MKMPMQYKNMAQVLKLSDQTLWGLIYQFSMYIKNVNFEGTIPLIRNNFEEIKNVKGVICKSLVHRNESVYC